MNSTMKKIFAGVLCGAMISLASVGAYAQTASYSTATEKYVVGVVNDGASNKTLHANTRPSDGKGGAWVKIKLSNGTVKASQLFSYYTASSDLTASLPSGEIRRIYVKPNTSGQTISGTLTYFTR